jgi:hypothetical protein
MGAVLAQGIHHLLIGFQVRVAVLRQFRER